MCKEGIEKAAEGAWECSGGHREYCWWDAIESSGAVWLSAEDLCQFFVGNQSVVDCCMCASSDHLVAAVIEWGKFKGAIEELDEVVSHFVSLEGEVGVNYSIFFCK